MNTDHTDHQSALIGNAVIDSDGILRPALITARHWSDGDIEIFIRPLHTPGTIIIDRADLAAINTLLRAQPAIPVDGHPDPAPADHPHIQFTPSDTPTHQSYDWTARLVYAEEMLDAAKSRLTELEEQFDALQEVVRVIYTQSPTAQQDQINTLLVRTSALAKRLDAVDVHFGYMDDRRDDDDAKLTRRLLIRDKRLTKLETNVRALIAQADQAEVVAQ